MSHAKPRELPLPTRAPSALLEPLVEPLPEPSPPSIPLRVRLRRMTVGCFAGLMVASVPSALAGAYGARWLEYALLGVCWIIGALGGLATDEAP